MKRLFPVLLLILFGEFVIAGPGSGHHKDSTYDYDYDDYERGGHHKAPAYDYHDYVNSNIQSKTFARHQNDGVVYDEVWSFDRPDPGEVVRTEIATDADGSIFRCRVNRFEVTAEVFKWAQQHSCDGSTPPVLINTTDYIPPLSVFTNAMVPGIAWGAAGEIHTTYTLDNYYTDVSEVLAVEDVTVPAGTYNDCLKIYRQRAFMSYIPRIEWVCPNMGLVKSVNGSNRLMELTDVTFNN